MGELKRRILKLINGAGAPLASAAKVEARRPAGREIPEIGSVLRATRIQAGLELRDVATMLKIRYVFMVAIEEGRYHELPGTAYAVGFVRAYADYLGLDSEAVVQRFKEEVAGKVSRQNLYFPTPVPEGRVPGGTILLFSVILICIVYGGWYVLSATDRSMVDVVPALPQRLVSLLGGVSSHGANGSTTTAVAAPAATPATAGPSGTAGTTSSGGTPAAEASSSVVPPAVGLPFATPTGGETGGAGEQPGGGTGPRPSGDPRPGIALPLPAASASTATAPPSPPAGTDTGTGESGDEIPLVSGPADETVRGPGPLVPMAPRTKPMPHAAGDAGVPAVPTAPPAPTGPTLPLAADAQPAAANPPPPPAPPPAADAGLPVGRTYGSQNREVHVLIKASQETWMQIRNADGDSIFTKVLHPGDVYRVPDRAGTRLRTGNAGGLLLIIDGGEAQPLGPVGQVLRDVPVDAASLRKGRGAGN